VEHIREQQERVEHNEEQQNEERQMQQKEKSTKFSAAASEGFITEDHINYEEEDHRDQCKTPHQERIVKEQLYFT